MPSEASLSSLPQLELVPLYGYLSSGSCAPLSTLLRIGPLNVLLDCGLSDRFEVGASLAALARVAPHVDAVLLSSGSLSSVGALPVAVRAFGLACPIYAVSPVATFGLLELEAAVTRRLGYAHECSVSLADVSQVRTWVRRVTFAQEVVLRRRSAASPVPFGRSPSGGGGEGADRGVAEVSCGRSLVCAMAYAAGGTLGASCWRLTHGLEDVVYAGEMDDGDRALVGGVALAPLARATAVLVRVPSAATRDCGAGGRLLALLADTVRAGGTALLPCAATAPMLGVLHQLLEWARGRGRGPASVLGSCPVYVVSSVAREVLLRQVNTFHRYMRLRHGESFASTLRSPFALPARVVCEPSGVALAEQLAATAAASPPSGSRGRGAVVLLGGASLESSDALALFGHVARDPASTVIFLRAPTPGTFAATVLGSPQRARDAGLGRVHATADIYVREPVADRGLAAAAERERVARRRHAETAVLALAKPPGSRSELWRAHTVSGPDQPSDMPSSSPVLSLSATEAASGAASGPTGRRESWGGVNGKPESARRRHRTLTRALGADRAIAAMVDRWRENQPAWRALIHRLGCDGVLGSEDDGSGGPDSWPAESLARAAVGRGPLAPPRLLPSSSQLLSSGPATFWIYSSWTTTIPPGHWAGRIAGPGGAPALRFPWRHTTPAWDAYGSLVPLTRLCYDAVANQLMVGADRRSDRARSDGPHTTPVNGTLLLSQKAVWAQIEGQAPMSVPVWWRSAVRPGDAAVGAATAEPSGKAAGPSPRGVGMGPWPSPSADCSLMPLADQLEVQRALSRIGTVSGSPEPAPEPKPKPGAHQGDDDKDDAAAGSPQPASSADDAGDSGAEDGFRIVRQTRTYDVACRVELVPYLAEMSQEDLVTVLRRIQPAHAVLLTGPLATARALAARVEATGDVQRVTALAVWRNALARPPTLPAPHAWLPRLSIATGVPSTSVYLSPELLAGLVATLVPCNGLNVGWIEALAQPTQVSVRALLAPDTAPPSAGPGSGLPGSGGGGGGGSGSTGAQAASAGVAQCPYALAGEAPAAILRPPSGSLGHAPLWLGQLSLAMLQAHLTRALGESHATLAGPVLQLPGEIQIRCNQATNQLTVDGPASPRLVAIRQAILQTIVHI